MAETNLNALMERAKVNAQKAMRELWPGELPDRDRLEERTTHWLYNTALELQDKNLRSYHLIQEINEAAKNHFIYALINKKDSLYAQESKRHFLAKQLYLTLQGDNPERYEHTFMCVCRNINLELIKSMKLVNDRVADPHERKHIL